MSKQMNLEVVRLRRFEDKDSKLKAFVDVAVGEFIVRGLRIVQGKKGLFLGMPRHQGKDGRWYNSFYPNGQQAYQALNEVVLAAYQK